MVAYRNGIRDDRLHDADIFECETKRVLNNGLFWQNYKITLSPGDGHCKLHSVISSYNSQHNHIESLNIGQLIALIQQEVMNNVPYYIRVIEDNCQYKLIAYLNMYIYEKMYNTSFGDLVLIITANAIDMNIAIIDKTNNGYTCHIVHVTKCDSVVCGNTVFINKDGDHYNGLLFSSQFGWPGNDNITTVHGDFAHSEGEVSNNKLLNRHCSNSCEIDTYFKYAEARDDNGAILRPTNVSVQGFISNGNEHNCMKYDIRYCCWNICGLT